jgi:hypothetical protein
VERRERERESRNTWRETGAHDNRGCESWKSSREFKRVRPRETEREIYREREKSSRC